MHELSYYFYFLKVAQDRKGITMHVSDLIKKQLLCGRVVTTEAWKKGKTTCNGITLTFATYVLRNGFF